MNAEVRNNPPEYRYEVWADGELAGYTQYVLRSGRIAFVHTKVDESYEGLGGARRCARPGTGGNAVLPVHRGLHRAPPR